MHLRSATWEEQFNEESSGWPYDSCHAALDVIRAIAVNAAEMLGRQDKIGAIKPEK